MRLIAFGLVILSLQAGCLKVHWGDCPVRTVTQTVKVPVPIPCPPPTVPARPKLLADSLPAGTPVDALVRAIYADRIALMGYIRQLEAALQPYLPAPQPQPPANP